MCRVCMHGSRTDSSRTESRKRKQERNGGKERKKKEEGRVKEGETEREEEKERERETEPRSIRAKRSSDRTAKRSVNSRFVRLCPGRRE